MSGVDIWLIVMGVFFTLAGRLASSIHLGMLRSTSFVIVTVTTEDRGDIDAWGIVDTAGHIRGREMNGSW
jgi:hypothetical protein